MKLYLFNIKTSLFFKKNKSTARKSSGFTIVELLIVIVIIGILAALVILAYTGIQARAYDTSVKSDFTNFAKKVRLFEADNDVIPPGGSRVGNSAGLPGIQVAIAENAYDLSVVNLSYCEGTISGTPVFAISAKSKSGTVFAYKSWQGGIENRGNVGHGVSSACTGIDSGTTGVSYGYNNTLNTWWSWTQG